MRITIFQGIAGRWYWRARGRNNRTVADGSEGYASRRNALRAARGFCLRMRGMVEVVG